MDSKTQRVIQAVKDLFSDRSVSVQVSRERLEQIRDEIELLLETLPEESGD